MSRILIAGCGDIGSALGVRLQADGHEVWGLRRSTHELPKGIQALQADLMKPDDLRQLPDDVDAAFYIVTPDVFDDRAYESVYVRGPENLLMALAARGQSVRRLIFVSSTSVYGQSKGEWIDENSPTKPGQFSGKRLLEGERLVLGSSIQGLVVRFGGIYGRGANRLLQQVLKGSPCQESPPLYTNRIHRDDCVEVLRHLLTLSEPEQIYLGVDSEPATQCAVMDWLAKQLGVPVPPRSAATASRGERLRTSKRCRNARLLATGYRFLYPSFRDGYQAILAQERSPG